MRQVKIHQHAAFINALVEFPQTAFRSPVIPSRELLIDLAHCLDVKTAVVTEALPLYRVRVLRGPAYFATLRLRFAE
ncbi:hypothetical protein D3C81_2261590 [compost metagenome]